MVQLSPVLPTARDVSHAIADWIVEQITGAGFRGCAFLDAAAEHPDADSGVQCFVMIRDGARASGCLADREAVRGAFLRGVEAMLVYRPIAEPHRAEPA